MNNSKRDLEDQSVVAVLRMAGIDVDSIYDLVNARRTPKAAIQPLLDVLPDLADPVIKGGVVRALTDRSVRGVAAKPLIRELVKVCESGQESLGWIIGNALVVVADDTVFDDLAELATNPSLGNARETVVEALGSTKRPESAEILISLLEEDDVAGHAIIALRRLKATAAFEHIVPFLEHPKSWVRREAKKTIKALEKYLD